MSPKASKSRKPFDLSTIRDRVVEMKRMRAGDLHVHPGQWKDHTEDQTAPLYGLLRQVGIVDALLAWPPSARAAHSRPLTGT